MEINSTLLTGMLFQRRLERRRPVGLEQVKRESPYLTRRASSKRRQRKNGNETIATTNVNNEKCTSFMLRTKTVARVMLWLSVATGLALATDVSWSEQPASTNFNGWEYIEYPGIRLSPELAKSNAWVNLRIANSSVGLFMGVTSFGEPV